MINYFDKFLESDKLTTNETQANYIQNHKWTRHISKQSKFEKNWRQKVVIRRGEDETFL